MKIVVLRRLHGGCFDIFVPGASNGPYFRVQLRLDIETWFQSLSESDKKSLSF